MHYNRGSNMDTVGGIPTFKDKDVAAGTPGSTVLADYEQAITMEMKAVIEEGGLTMATSAAGDPMNQMKEAIFESEAIGTEALSDNAVVTSKIADGQVTSNKLATNSVSTAKIVDGAVTKEKFGTNMIPQFTNKSEEEVATSGNIASLTWTSPATYSTKVRVTINYKVSRPVSFGVGTATLEVQINGGSVVRTNESVHADNNDPSYCSFSFVSTTVTGSIFTVSAGISGDVEFENIDVTYETIPGTVVI